MATIECVDELALFLVSLRHAHPITPIWVATTQSLLNLLRPTADSNAKDNPFLDVVRTFAAPAVHGHHHDHQQHHHFSGSGFVSTSNVHWVPLIHDAYLPISRGAMERTPGVFYPTRHADFMMEKSTVLELALAHAQLSNAEKEEQGNADSSRDSQRRMMDEDKRETRRRTKPMVLFLDCDICTLARWPRIPVNSIIALSRHGIRREDELLWGTYNGGVVGVRQPEALFQWRKHTLKSRFHDQASLEDVAAWSERNFGADSVAQLPVQTNYGYWRMMQTSRELTENVLSNEISKFSMKHCSSVVGADDDAAAQHQRGDHLLHYQGKPLQSVHTHLFVPPAKNSSASMPLFNALLVQWLRSSQSRSYQHIVRLLAR
ncbi:Hypothetical protein, putative [Bodo saltans]|uniref:Uncharacterized protein n=1 Tax=Bodo saltans TaxID=75058 RepID=A0A0S4J3X3_BODSA|nr:Hypothetical protein, putative [Bodo saltans]|eukprot:CUG71936.1 Hypothetical protein, putative [Bodo saltans]